MTSSGEMADSNPIPNAEEVHRTVDLLFRERSGQLVARLTRRLGISNLDVAEEAVQDTLLKALRKWPYEGIPENPMGWILVVARNRALDMLRRGRRQEDLDESSVGGRDALGDVVESEGPRFARELIDDQLRLMFACCDPSLPIDAQVALTLKTVGGFSVPELARAFLVPKTTMAQRIVRAKRKLRALDRPLEIPSGDDLAPRVDSVLEVLYLMFNEGYAASEGEELIRFDLCQEAIRLTEVLCDHPLASTPTAHALSALFCFQASRFPTRIDSDGDLVLISEQDRSRWDRGLIARGLRHFEAAASGSVVSDYHLEAEIACQHVIAPEWEATDWNAILRCYDALLDRKTSPIVALNRVVPIMELDGPEAALAALDELGDRSELESYYPAWAIRGEILARLGRTDAALAALARALDLVESLPIRRFLERRRSALGESAAVN